MRDLRSPACPDAANLGWVQTACCIVSKDCAVTGDDEAVSTAENYRRFAHLEARGRSPLYEELTEAVAGDLQVLRLIASLPAAKRQPNLLLGAVRYLYGTAPDYLSFRNLVVERWTEVRSTILRCRTQTNEVARCATLLPTLAALPQPLALLEVGASAGLCLLVDRYRYDYGQGIIGPASSPVLLRCEVRGPSAPMPTDLPEVAWRAGIDLNPIDLGDESAIRWLEALVWPGEGDRLARLRHAIEVARRDPPRVVRSDLRAGLSDVIPRVPNDATLVVFHSAVLAYVPSSDRDAFAASVARVGAVWIANEAAGVLPAVQRQLSDNELTDHQGHFLLSLNGTPIAWTDPHGSWLRWRGDGELEGQR
jgi:hypothetical protein